MLSQRRRNKPKAEVPGASMADIAFLLIIFFMVSTSYSKDKTTVELPNSSEEQRVEIPKNAIIISIQKNGEIRANGDGYPVFELGGFVQANVTANPAQMFQVKADRGVPFFQVDAVLDQLRSGGARYICFPTNPDKTEDGSAPSAP